MKRDKLIERRNKLGFTQERVAERAGISRAHYSKIELGLLKDITVNTAIAIGNALNYKVDPKGIFEMSDDDAE